MSEKVVAINKKASFKYLFIERYEAGIQLKGSEVKSLRAKKIDFSDSYAILKNGELFLINCHIATYPPAARFNHEPARTRKLLLHRAEIESLIGKIQRQRLTLIPTRIYFKNGRAKIELALARGKKQTDRREEIKKRTEVREIEQAIKRRR